MKFFTVNPEIDNELNKVLSLINLRKNGETAEMLNRMGMNYRLNYGVSLVHIRQIAASTPHCNELARRLWHRHIRETMIIATLIADPNTMDAEELLEWARMVHNTELAEQTSMNLFARYQEFPFLVHDFLKNNSPFIKATAYFSLAWWLRNPQTGHTGTLALINGLTESCQPDHPIMARGLSMLLRQTIRQFPDGPQFAKHWIEKKQHTDNPNLQLAIEETRQELEYFSLPK
ncbi:MAG: DNA alkylation repair protein [Breznakibacter sp.]